MKNTEKITQVCSICSGKDTKLVFEHTNFFGTRIWFCYRCNYWFSYPEPECFKLDRYYRKTYSQWRRTYFGKEYYAVMERRAEAQLRFIEQYLKIPEIQCKLRRWRVIDWGCGIGALVFLFQQQGVDVIGYDSDLEAIEIGRKRWNANIRPISSSDLNEFRGQFDLLLLSHIVEHLPDIRQTLQNLLELLKPGGYVFIEVPDCYVGMFKKKADLESHLNFFTKKSLVKLLQLLNLEVVACLNCGPRRQQKVWPLIQKIQFKFTKQWAKSRLRKPQKIKTIYDNYFDKYYPEKDESSIWLRCLACKTL